MSRTLAVTLGALLLAAPVGAAEPAPAADQAADAINRLFSNVPQPRWSEVYLNKVELDWASTIFVDLTGEAPRRRPVAGLGASPNKVPMAFVLLGPNCPDCLSNLQQLANYASTHKDAVSGGAIVLPGTEPGVIAALTKAKFSYYEASDWFAEHLGMNGIGRAPAILFSYGDGRLFRILLGYPDQQTIARVIDRGAISRPSLWEAKGKTQLPNVLADLAVGFLPPRPADAPSSIRMPDTSTDALWAWGKQSSDEQTEYGSFFSYARPNRLHTAVLYPRFGGGKTSVYLDASIQNLINDREYADKRVQSLITVHTHPGGTSFSPRDLLLAAVRRRAGIVAYAPARIDLVLPTEETDLSWADFRKVDALMSAHFLEQLYCSQLAKSGGKAPPAPLAALYSQAIARTFKLALYASGDGKDADPQDLARTPTDDGPLLDFTLRDYKVRPIDVVKMAAAFAPVADFEKELNGSRLAKLFEETPSREEFISMVSGSGRTYGPKLDTFIDGGAPGSRMVTIFPVIAGGRCTDDIAVTFATLTASGEDAVTASYVIKVVGGRYVISKQ